MSYQRLLGVYHYCMAYHSGQGSREYRVLSRVTARIRPSRSEQFPSIMENEGYEEARATYEALGGEL